MTTDGAVKVRPVDDMSVSGVNGATYVRERLKCDTIDTFWETAKSLHEAGAAPLSIFKADIDSAYRRVGIAPGPHIFAFTIKA